MNYLLLESGSEYTFCVARLGLGQVSIGTGGSLMAQRFTRTISLVAEWMTCASHLLIT
jgi:hypothetical protein